MLIASFHVLLFMVAFGNLRWRLSPLLYFLIRDLTRSSCPLRLAIILLSPSTLLKRMWQLGSRSFAALVLAKTRSTLLLADEGQIAFAMAAGYFVGMYTLYVKDKIYSTEWTIVLVKMIILRNTSFKE